MKEKKHSQNQTSDLFCECEYQGKEEVPSLETKNAMRDTYDTIVHSSRINSSEGVKICRNIVPKVF